MFGMQAPLLFTRSNRKPGRRDAARLIRDWICFVPEKGNHRTVVTEDGITQRPLRNAV
jgi:hypothetical protein